MHWIFDPVGDPVKPLTSLENGKERCSYSVNEPIVVGSMLWQSQDMAWHKMWVPKNSRATKKNSGFPRKIEYPNLLVGYHAYILKKIGYFLSFGGGLTPPPPCVPRLPTVAPVEVPRARKLNDDEWAVLGWQGPGSNSQRWGLNFDVPCWKPSYLAIPIGNWSSNP